MAAKLGSGDSVGGGDLRIFHERIWIGAYQPIYSASSKVDSAECKRGYAGGNSSSDPKSRTPYRIFYFRIAGVAGNSSGAARVDVEVGGMGFISERGDGLAG